MHTMKFGRNERIRGSPPERLFESVLALLKVREVSLHLLATLSLGSFEVLFVVFPLLMDPLFEKHRPDVTQEKCWSGFPIPQTVSPTSADAFVEFPPEVVPEFDC